MTAYSFKTHATRDKIAGDRTPLITIQHGHPLNNDHRAPFASGSTAARALLVHAQRQLRSEEHTSELQSLMRISYAVFCLKKKNHKMNKQTTTRLMKTANTENMT